jgi:rare lipoprotein A
MRKTICSMMSLFVALLATPALASSQGNASWYGPGFHGRATASGERFNSQRMTCASRSLAFGTKIRVTCLSSGKSVVVLVNDRGPYVGERIIDLSQGAFSRLAPLGRGVIRVKIEVVNEPKRRKVVR